MKTKFLTMAAAALAAGLCVADVESSNVVGYQTIKIPGNASGSAWTLFTVTFKKTGGGALPINTIKVLNENGAEFDDSVSANRCRNTIKLQKINSSTAQVIDAETYQYTTRNAQGWHVIGDSSGKLADTVTLADGEGVYVTSTQKKDVYLQVSGEVEVAPMSFAIPYTAASAYCVFGNFTPSVIKVNEIKVLNENKEEFDDSVSANRCRNTIKLQKINTLTAQVMDEETYQYTTRNAQGWHRIGDSSGKLEDTVTLAPGEAVYVTSTQKKTVYLQLKSPLTGNYAAIK